jgi:hypothetical protein
MSDAISAGMSRRQLLEAAGTAAAVVAAASLAAPAQAATPETSPFKLTVTWRPQAGLTIPFDPPVRYDLLTGEGQADLLGNFTLVAHRRLQLGLDGKVLWGGTDAGVVSGANGDALFYAHNLLAGAPAPVFLITGGKGRFCGASGSGTVTTVAGPNAGESISTWEGTIQVLK